MSEEDHGDRYEQMQLEGVDVARVAGGGLGDCRERLLLAGRFLYVARRESVSYIVSVSLGAHEVPELLVLQQCLLVGDFFVGLVEVPARGARH